MTVDEDVDETFTTCWKGEAFAIFNFPLYFNPFTFNKRLPTTKHYIHTHINQDFPHNTQQLIATNSVS